MKISTETSQKIKNMSFVCSLLVVSIHVVWCADNTFSLGWFIEQGVKQGIARIAVPFFFVVSGFFLTQHFDEEGWWKREVKKRISSLVIPFFIWSLVNLLAKAPISIICDLIAGRPFGTNLTYLHDNFNWTEFLGVNLMRDPSLGPLWFLRCLFFLLLLSGFFKWGVTHFKKYWIISLFAFELFRLYIPHEQTQEFLMWGLSTNGMFYFSVGIFLHYFNPPPLSHRSAIMCGLCGILLLIIKMITVGIFNDDSYEPLLRRVLIPFFLYFVWHIIPTKRWFDQLTSCSFPIYLMHLIVFKFIIICLPNSSFNDLSRAFILFMGGIILPILMTNFLRCRAPRISLILFGGRF